MTAYILSFWHKLIIWYWINNYLIEYKLDVTSLVSHWKQWVSLQVIRKFSEDKVVGLGGGEYLEEVIPGSKSLYNPWISPSWLWLYVKWPIKQKCCGPRAEKAIQTQGVGFQRPMYLLVCCSQTLCIHGYIFWDQSRKLLRGIFFFWKVYNFFQMEDNFYRRLYHNWEY